MKLGSFLFASFLLSSSAMAQVSVDFAGACSNGDFQAVGNDISYFNLDLDLFEGRGGEAKDCSITTTIPARRGFLINVSAFQAEAFAEIESRDGLATLLVNHRFKGQIVGSNRDVARRSEGLIARQGAVAVSKCSEEIQLRTRISTRAKDAVLFLDNAQSNTVSYRFAYVRCP